MTPSGRVRRFSVEINGKLHEVKVEEIFERSVISETKKESAKLPKESETSPKKTEDRGREGDRVVTSPMQGTILKITVKVGDKVKKGDIVAILEAMKMENEIISERSGVIEDINVSEGEAVNAGTVLLKFKKTK